MKKREEKVLSVLEYNNYKKEKKKEAIRTVLFQKEK